MVDASTACQHTGCARRFMAPEVLSSRVVPASDIWSAGVMAHQLLVRRAQWQAHKSEQIQSLVWLSGSGCVKFRGRACCWRLLRLYARRSIEPACVVRDGSWRRNLWLMTVACAQTGRFPFDDRRCPSKPAITKIWCACQKLM